MRGGGDLLPERGGGTGVARDGGDYSPSASHDKDPILLSHSPRAVIPPEDMVFWRLPTGTSRRLACSLLTNPGTWATPPVDLLDPHPL